MPKKVIGQELTQEDLMFYRDRLSKDLSVLDITVEVMGTSNGWWAVQARCIRANGLHPRLYKTHTTYITKRGPHLVTVMCKHLDALYHIVDRADAGLPPPIGL